MDCIFDELWMNTLGFCNSKQSEDITLGSGKLWYDHDMFTSVAIQYQFHCLFFFIYYKFDVVICSTSLTQIDSWTFDKFFATSEVYCDEIQVSLLLYIAYCKTVCTIIPSLACAIYPVILTLLHNQLWKHWFINKQESTHWHDVTPPLWSPPEKTVWTLVWLTERQGAEHGGGGHTVHHRASQHTDRPHTWQCSQSATPHLSLHANNISSWFSRLPARNMTTMTSLATYKYIKKQFGCWMTTNKEGDH